MSEEAPGLKIAWLILETIPASALISVQTFWYSESAATLKAPPAAVARICRRLIDNDFTTAPRQKGGEPGAQIATACGQGRRRAAVQSVFT